MRVVCRFRDTPRPRSPCVLVLTPLPRPSHPIPCLPAANGPRRRRQVAFFKTIRAEIAKATEFYLGMEQQLGARKRRIRWARFSFSSF